MPVLSNLIVRIGASTDDFDKQVDRALNKTKRLATTAVEAGTALAVGFSAPLIAAGAGALAAAANMESLEKGLTATMKSSSAAAAELQRLKEVSKLPGLGLQEAVQGSIRLQTLGSTAAESRRIMAELGNALAIVGGGKLEFGEVIRQLSQMAAVGKVTKENLDPIVERIPQVAAIIKEKFGAAALGDPAKTFEKMGMSAQQFITVVVDELAKGDRAGKTFSNSMENLRESAFETAAEFGKSLLPVAQKVLNEFLVPGVEKAKALADAFNGLSPATQNVAIAVTSLAAALPLVVVALGTLVEKSAVLIGALNRLLPILKPMAGLFSAAGVAAAAAAGGVAYFMSTLIANRQNAVDTSAEALKKLNERVGTGTPAAFGAGSEAILGYMRVLKPMNEEQGKSAEFTAKADDAKKKHVKTITEAKTATMELLALQERMRQADSDRTEAVRKLADLMRTYNAVTFDQIKLNAQAADAAARYFRVLENPPDIRVPGIGGGMKDVPKAPQPTFPGDFEAYKKSTQNIGDLGMQTKAQYEAMANSAKGSSRVQQAAMRQVSTVITDLSRGIADVIFSGEGLAKMFANVAKQAAQSITRLLIEGALTQLANKIMNVGGLFGKVFGGGTGAIMSATGGAGSAAASAAGGAGKSAAGIAGVAASGAMGMVGAIAGIGSLVSGIVGNFQMAGMNKTLDLIEKETRYSQIHLLNILEKGNEFWPYMKAAWESLVRMESRQMDLAANGGGGVSITINTTGDTRAILDALTRELKQLGVLPR